MSTFYCLQSECGLQAAPKEKYHDEPLSKPALSIPIHPVVLACVLPPVAVFLERGCGAEVIICIALCCLALLPGMIYALYIVCKVRNPIWEPTHRLV